MMIARLLPALMVLGLAGSAVAAESVTFTNPPLTTFSDDKPAYMYFKEGTLSRDGKLKVNVDITLDGEIPNALTDRKVVYFFAFDIDNSAATGSKAITFPGFGNDMSISLTKEEKETRFMGSSSSLVYKGKHIDIKISKLKVSGDKITCQLSSELFGVYDSFRVYVMSTEEFFEHNLSKSNDTVDQLPRHGAMTLKAEAK